MELAKRVPTADESHGLGVVHSHAAEHLTDGVHAVHGLGNPHHTLGIYIDETDGAGAQGCLAISVLLRDGNGAWGGIVATGCVRGRREVQGMSKYSIPPTYRVEQRELHNK